MPQGHAYDPLAPFCDLSIPTSSRVIVLFQTKERPRRDNVHETPTFRLTL